MNYVVLDLEWNQPVSFHDQAYKTIGNQLLFELLQIGAVKLNADLKIVDSFSQMIQPTYYTKLHPRIRRITHIEPEDVENAPAFCEAMDAFLRFCGEDYILLTWGCDDISVLYQNMRVFEYSKTLSPMYDLQQLFADEHEMPKRRMNLQSALESISIEALEEKPFHNAVNDAYYTALIFQRCKNAQNITKYLLSPRELKHTERHIREQQAIFHPKNGLSGFMLSPSAQRPPCICCGQSMKVPEGYLEINPDVFCALADCKQHGLSFVYLKNGKDERGKKAVIRTVKLSDEQHKAYISTKHWQWKNALQSKESTGVEK